jgi:hypothetical protein
VPIIVERRYFRGPNRSGAGGHERGRDRAADAVVPAEGATGSFFNMFILIATGHDPRPSGSTTR